MKSTTPSRILRYAALACACVAAILETVAIFTDFSPSSNYFTRDAVLPVIASILALTGCAAGILSALLTSETQLHTTVFKARSATTPATFGFLTAAVFSFFYAGRTTLSQLKTIAYLSGILLIGGLIYTVLSGFSSMRNRPSLTVSVGFFAILGTILLNAYYYFDISMEMNAPLKLTTQMGLLCTTIYYTGELRYLLGTQKPRMFLALCTTLLSTGSLCSLSVLIAFLADITDRGDYAAGALLVFCVMLSALLRMLTLLSKERIEKDTKSKDVYMTIPETDSQNDSGDLQ